ncbi:MAG: DUF4838 domain-containing protein [Ferruginibacter sp.]
MKKICFNFLLILFFKLSSGQANSIAIYYTPVDMPAILKNSYYRLTDTRLLAEDLAALLNKATGNSFTPVPHTANTTKGIFLILDSNNRSLGSEEGVLESDGKSFIRITGRYTTGISYAMYSWLESLGFHFYLPGDEWTSIPSMKTLFKNKITKQHYKPYFHTRMFYASGAIFHVKGLDETGQNEKDWRQWYLRNRMGCDYLSIDGHIGEVFNITHRKEIESDTLMVAPINGKRQFSNGSKLDPTYKKGTELFSNWIVEEFLKERSATPNFLPFKKFYTTDAGDGLDYCHTPECEKQFKTVSDQVFSITNQTARKIKLADSRAGVSAMAYGERTDTPGIRIEPNVHIMVVPNAFQTVSTSAEIMKRWAKKSKNISVYDYLNIGVWAQDMPFFDLYQYHNYMQYLKSLKIEGISYETSLSKLGSGIQQYFILKYLCDPYSSVGKLLDEFCKNNFGAAAMPIKKLLKEWYFSPVHLKTNYNYPSFYEDELGRFVQYIVDAESIPGLSASIKKRIEELKAYTIYLCKFYELFAELKSLQAYATDPSLKSKNAESLLTYTWQLYKSKIFHNTQLNDMLKKMLTDQQKEKWDYYKSDQFKNISNDVASVVRNEFEKIKNKYLPLAAPDYPVTDSFLAANASLAADSIRIATTDEKAIPNFIYPLDFYCAAPGTLKIKYEAGKSQLDGSTGKVALVSVESADYKFIKTNAVYKQESNGTFLYQLPVKGHYRLYLSQFNATHVGYIIYPGNNLFYHNKKSIMMNTLLMQDIETKNPYPNKFLAFYAPQTDSIYFSNLYAGSKNTSNLYTPSGKPIAVYESKQTFYNSAAVPKNQKYPFMFYENSLFRWPPVLKNTAAYYFFLKYPLKPF